jgi:hypothetical protein
MIKPYLHIKKSPKRGRGVFTKEPIKKGIIVEISPMIVFPVKEVENILKTKMSNYVFQWGSSGKKMAIALGWGSLYNHSYKSNCQYTTDHTNNRLVIKTVRPIKKDEELFVNYNCVWNDSTPIWFDVK